MYFNSFLIPYINPCHHISYDLKPNQVAYLYHYFLVISTSLVCFEIGRIAFNFFYCCFLLILFLLQRCFGTVQCEYLGKNFDLCNQFWNLLALVLVHFLELLVQFNRAFISCFHFLYLLLIHPWRVTKLPEHVADYVFGDDVNLPHVGWTFKYILFSHPFLYCFWFAYIYLK